MNNISKIASMLTEDPDVFSDYEDAFREHSTLDDDVYGDIVRILKDVVEKNGAQLDHSKLSVQFNPAGLTLKNIYIDVVDPSVKRELIDRVAQTTGDDNIKHNFNKNLRINLYNAINREFADRVRTELNLEVSHQAMNPEDSENPSEVLPMATFTQPAVTAEPPEDVGMEEPMGPEPEGGPEQLAPPPEEGLPGGGMGLGSGGMPPLGGAPPGAEENLEEPPSPERGPEGEEELEGPEGAPEEPAPPPEEGEEEEMIKFESVQTIADLITDDPDIFRR